MNNLITGLKHSCYQFLFLSVFFFAFFSSCDSPESKGNVTTLFLVRHTEKVEDTEDDNPELTERGKERAQEIAVLLEKAEIDALYSTPYVRSIGSLKPLSEKSAVNINKYDEDLDLRDFINGILEKHTGERVVIVGHSTTIPGMLNVLMAENIYEELEHGRHDDLFQVIITGNDKVEIIHLKNSTKL